jgi:ATP-dependent helicase/nuclease subunit B
MRELVFYNKGDLSEDSTGERADMWKKAYAFFCKEYPETINKIMKSMSKAPEAEDIPNDQAKRLFTTSITSVSELEEFASCPYSHFVKYGLKPTDIRDYSFEADQKGIFYHAAMKAYIERAKQDKDFPNIDRKRIIEYFNEAVKPLVEELEDTSLSENTLSRMELTEYVQTVRVSAMYVTYWLAETKYMPEGCEVSFGKKESNLPPLVLNLPGGEKVALAGTIDRYDVYTDSTGQKYGRIIDYKSSAHNLDPDAVAEGYQLQLPIYLKALTTATNGMKPSGAFYQQITNAVVETESEDEAEVRKKVMKSTMLNGMYLVSENDELEKASGGSVKKQTKASKSVVGLTESEMETLLNAAQQKATEHAVNIEEGVISIAPHCDKGKNPCEYCKAKNICLIANFKAFGGDQE